MAKMEYEVQPLFAEPFFRTNLGDRITRDQVEFILNQEMEDNRQNLISKNKYLFEEPELKGVKDAVQEALDVYATEIMGLSTRLYVTQSWCLVNKPNVGMHGHSHSNSVVSGSLYYTDLPEPSSNMVFDRHRGYQQLELRPDDDKQNIFNTSLNVVTPKTRDLFLFSSGLQHFVEPNVADVPRYSIAFNTFLKGRLGDYRDVSELFLS